jgi:hypothetical protein
MKRSIVFAFVAALAIAPCASPAQSAMSASMLGVGPHGWDFYLGTWSCTNSVPSPTGGPATSTATITKNNAGAGLFFRATAQDFDESGYVAYSAKTKTWFNPASFGDGSYSYESTKQTGRKTVWAGTYFNAASGSTTQIRDTYTLSTGKYTDVTEMKTGVGWKMAANLTCTKS